MIIVFPFVFDILYTEKVAEINWIDKNWKIFTNIVPLEVTTNCQGISCKNKDYYQDS